MLQVQLQYVVDTLGFDCLWTATLLQPERTPYLHFMQAGEKSPTASDSS